MKILHVITTINLGGAENHLFDLIEAQVKAGLEIGVAYLKGDHFWRSHYEKLGVSVFPLHVSNISLFLRYPVLKEVIKSFNPDIVHAHMPPAEVMTRLALLTNKQLPFVISKHNDEPYAPVINNYFLGSWVAKRSEKIICISNAVKEYIERHHDIEPSKLHVIYYAVNVEKFQNATPAVDLLKPDDHLVFGTVARLTPQKSLHTLIEAFSLFVRTKKAYLYIAGTGELEQELKELCKKLNIEDKVKFLGKRHDIPSVMKALDVFVLPSIFEGFGLVLLEAMAAGTAIIASKVSAIPEVLDQGRSGYLFRGQDVNGLLEAMQEMSDKEKRERFIKNGHNRVMNFFSREKMEKETRIIYELVLQRK